MASNCDNIDVTAGPCSPIGCTGCGYCLAHCACPAGAGDFDLMADAAGRGLSPDEGVFEVTDAANSDTAVMPRVGDG